MPQEVYIVGVGMTRLGKSVGRSVKDLAREAVSAALRDAGCVWRPMVEALKRLPTIGCRYATQLT